MDILEIAGPALCQLIHAIYADEALQRDILTSRANNFWESDGHYERVSKSVFIERRIKEWWIDRSIGKRIIDAIQEERKSRVGRLTGKLTVCEGH